MNSFNNINDIDLLDNGNNDFNEFDVKMSIYKSILNKSYELLLKSISIQKEVDGQYLRSFNLTELAQNKTLNEYWVYSYYFAEVKMENSLALCDALMVLPIGFIFLKTSTKKIGMRTEMNVLEVGPNSELIPLLERYYIQNQEVFNGEKTSRIALTNQNLLKSMDAGIYTKINTMSIEALQNIEYLTKDIERLSSEESLFRLLEVFDSFIK